MTEAITLRQLDERSVAELKGVGPKKVAALASVGVTSVLDLLTTYPRRWVDRTEEARLPDRRVWFDTGWADTPIYDRERLPLEAMVAVPAVIEQLDTTVVLDAFKWSCEGCTPSEVDGCGIDPQ